MKQICKVHPSEKACKSCIKVQDETGVVKSCRECRLDNDTHELVQIIPGGLFTRDKALVLKSGKIEKVDLDRVYDIKNKED